MRVTQVDSTQYENLREFYKFCKIPRISGEEWPSPLQSFREIYQIRKIPAIWFNIRVTQYVSFREFYQFRKIPWITGWELPSPLIFGRSLVTVHIGLGCLQDNRLIKISFLLTWKFFNIQQISRQPPTDNHTWAVKLSYDKSNVNMKDNFSTHLGIFQHF